MINLTFSDLEIISPNSLKSESLLEPPRIKISGSLKAWIAAIAVSGVVEKESS